MICASRLHAPDLAVAARKIIMLAEMGNVTFFRVDVTVTCYAEKTHGRCRYSFLLNFTQTFPLLVTVRSLLFLLLVTMPKGSILSNNDVYSSIKAQLHYNKLTNQGADSRTIYGTPYLTVSFWNTNFTKL